MARYIDADALCKHFKILYEHAQENGLYNHAKLYDRAFRVVVDAPTEDVVPRETIEQIFEELERLSKILQSDYRRDNSETAQLIEHATDYFLYELKKKYIGG